VSAGPTLAALAAHVVTPVIREPDAARARAVIAALREGGFRVFEVTLSVPDAAELVAELASDPDLIVGVGTVLTSDDAARAAEAGARFVVSPAALPEVAAAAREAGAAAVLGALTPTEVLAARAAGADAVKVFPAASVGGPAHVKALRSVLPDVPLIPTGGVDLGNLRAYLDAGVHSVGVGGALSPPDLRDAPALARRYRAAARELAPSHGGSPRR
jgi:2-dehydro-3-deoxyphosphogluconate aldolase/(4S)-4-hydroxy-2-oxoglutarate aldolase